MIPDTDLTTDGALSLTCMPNTTTTAMETSHPAVSPESAPETEAFLSVWRTHARLLAESARLCRAYGITEQQYNVLRVLYLGDPEGMPCLEVAARLPNRVPDITRLLDRLLRMGLTNRERLASDRRVVRVSLSQKGLERVEEITPRLAELHRSRFSRLKSGELAELSRLLHKLSPVFVAS
ncbi:MAG: MarR family transcriptional regulator [bacterium]|nr:MarR family transcriptional regulator [bacterium]